ncbi:excisionase family DNA-binding protein [Microbacterium sp. NPDC058389]|uniref:excisionase family DNA-binding protein n=1 Tax=Microbacterium sp. NPDC058389 TaxID=3346475 RepID=UPI00365DB3AA
MTSLAHFPASPVDPADDRPEWGTMAEAAERATVELSTIRRWIASGRITAYRVGARNVRLDLRQVSPDRIGVPIGGAAARKAG